MRRLAEAAAWRVRLTEMGVESSREFEAWLSRGPEEAAAWVHVGGPWARFSEEATAPEMMRARSEALDQARREQARRHGHRLKTPWRAPAAVAASLAMLAVVTGGGYTVWRQGQPAVYSTGVGELRTAVLSDGSRVTMDADTLLQVRMGPATRRLELKRGQARFNVAHDASRPFSVHAGDRTVVATGTSFDVDVLRETVSVTLIRGRVVVLKDAPHGSDSPRRSAVVARLMPGERLVSPMRGAQDPPAPEPPVERVDLIQSGAWESGQLIAADEPLSQILERVSRYSVHPILAVGAAGALRLSGVFDATDTQGFLDALQRALPVRAEAEADGAVVLRQTGATKES